MDGAFCFLVVIGLTAIIAVLGYVWTTESPTASQDPGETPPVDAERAPAGRQASYAKPGAARIGSVMRIREVGSTEVETLRLVWKVSTEPQDGYEEVSANSPVGEALMQATAGETVRVIVPQGVRSFQVLTID